MTYFNTVREQTCHVYPHAAPPANLSSNVTAIAFNSADGSKTFTGSYDPHSDILLVSHCEKDGISTDVDESDECEVTFMSDGEESVEAEESEEEEIPFSIKPRSSYFKMQDLEGEYQTEKDILPVPKASKKHKTPEEIKQKVAADDPQAYLKRKRNELARNELINSRDHSIRCVKRRDDHSVEAAFVVYLNQDIGTPGRSKAPKVSAYVENVDTNPFYTLYAFSEVDAPIGSDVRILLETELKVSTYLEEKVADKTHFLPTSISFRDNVAMIASPLCDADLSQIIPELNMRERLEVAAQVVNAIIILHENNILYRDIQPSNFLCTMDKRGHIQIKVTDFETSAILGTDIGRDDIEFNSYYMDPWVINNYLSNRKWNYRYSDTYSLGLTLFNIFTQYTSANL